MGSARRKGSGFEREMAALFQSYDGRDPMYAGIETEGGRLGNSYHLRTDFVTTRYAAECKCREDLPARIWEWLDNIGIVQKTPILLLKRNRRRPLVVLEVEDFLTLVHGSRS